MGRLSIIYGAILALAAATAQAQRPPDIVKGQAAFASAHLRSMLAMMGADPEGAFSKRALQEGKASRGASLRESLASSFAMVEAGLRACPAVSGPCQDQARAAGEARALAVRWAPNPKQEMAKQLSALDEALQAAKAQSFKAP